MHERNGFLTKGQTLGCPRFNFTKTDKQDGRISKLRRERIVWVQDETVDRRFVDISVSRWIYGERLAHIFGFGKQ